MSNRFYISDTHFNHQRILLFTHRDSDLRIRPLWENTWDGLREMNETMIQNWNSKVGPRDVVWHLGDVFFGSESEGLNYVRRLNGRIKLILGNHDHVTPEFVSVFDEIMLWKRVRHDDMVLSHMPLHSSVLDECSPTAVNYHGHIHQNKSPKSDKPGALWWSPDHEWVNLSVENIDFTPVAFEELKHVTR